MSTMMFIIGLVVLIIGLSLVFGLGWALIIADLMTGGGMSDYQDAQKTIGPNKKLRNIGIFLIISSVVLLLYSFT